MTTVLFVHGTGVREQAYRQTFDQVEAALTKHVRLERCYWGHLGAELRAGGASVPEYDTSRAIGDDDTTNVSDLDYSVALWGILYEDPLYELRALAARGVTAIERPPGQLAPGDSLANSTRKFEITPALGALLVRGGIRDEFEKSREAVTGSEPYREALKYAPQALVEYRCAIARALIAEAAARAAEELDSIPPEVTLDAALRDEIEDALIELLGGRERALGGWVKRQFGGMALRVATRIGRRRRRSMSDGAGPVAGDILLYQVRGQPIRDFIRERIAACEKPVVVIAHSLGGIACVDLMAGAPIEGVKLLVTVGSQSPFFYEIGALHSLKFGEELPGHFPPWLNIYDPRDFLSYKGAKVFPGKVKDVQVDNRQPFPWSHSAYWANKGVWTPVIEKLP